MMRLRRMSIEIQASLDDGFHTMWLHSFATASLFAVDIVKTIPPKFRNMFATDLSVELDEYIGDDSSEPLARSGSQKLFLGPDSIPIHNYTILYNYIVFLGPKK